MRVDAFDFDLPDAAIALRPARPRDTARLLVVRPGGHPHLEGRIVRDLPVLLRPGDALVVNDTQVVPARLSGTRRRGEAVATVNATLHARLAPDLWRAFVKPARKLRPGDRVRFGGIAEQAAIVADVVTRSGGEVTLRFDRAGDDLDAALARVGRVPLPPYIEARRVGDTADETDYQTLFADRPGAVAAPTAGLHFTADLLAALAARGIALHRVTLHVGAGTFLPVKAASTEDHVMHAETGEVAAGVARALNDVRRAGGRIVAVGTTSLRLLESAADTDGLLRPFAGSTSIFITPGYRFRAVDALMTNFHLPRSTLFMLVSAFAGIGLMRDAYAHAIAAGYRFYSYGDASLLWPQATAGGTA